MRINWLLPGIEISGGVICVLRHAAGLQRRGHQVTVFVSAPPAPATLALLPTDVRGVALQAAPGALPEADVQIATHYNTVLTVAQAPAALRAHFVQHVETLFAQDAPNTELVHPFVKMTLQLPVYHIANSSWARATLERLFGYRPDIAINASHGPTADPNGPGVSRPATVVSFVHPARWKGTADAYNAMVLARELEPSLDLQWHVYGGGAVPEQPWVHHHGVVGYEELPKLYRQADAVLFTSWAESYPLPPLEAMAEGAVLVTTPVGLEDYLRPGENALVVPPRNPRAAADTLLDALTAPDEQRRLWQRAGQATAARHTWGAAVAGMEQALERGLSRGPRHDPRDDVLAELGIPVVTG